MLLGQALVATDNKAYTDEAIGILRAAVARETEAPLGYTQLAMAYGRKGDLRGSRPGIGAGRVSSRRQQDRARTRLARQDPLRRRHARMGQGRRHRRGKAAAGPKEQLEITDRPNDPKPARYRRRFRKPALQELALGNALTKDLPMPSFRLLVPALFALALCAMPPAASAQSFSDTQRGEIETIVRNYLIAHPGSAGRGDGRTQQAPGRCRSREA